MADDARRNRDGSTRRTVVRVAAWTAPVVAVAAAAPAFATSAVNGIENRKYTLASDNSQVRITDISVTNDGPSVLSARTVRLFITSVSGDILDSRSTTGSWLPDPASTDFGTQLAFLYDATIPVGETVPLIGSVGASVVEAGGLRFNISIVYSGPA